jgi:polar amino acid transport system substrate-binding protein
MHRHFRAVAAAAVALLILSACAPDEPEPVDDPAALDLVTDGVLTVCTDPPFAPFEFEDPDSPLGYSGFDIELIAAIAAAAGLDVEIVATGFEGLTSGATMAAGTCDIGAAAITITEERAEQIDFTDPYYDALQSLLVLEGSPIASIDDLVDGTVVGVQSGTTGEAYAQDNVPGAEIRSFEDVGDMLVALEAGTIDAVLQDLPVNAEYARDSDTAAVVEEYDTGESYGFALEQDRPDGLVEVLNAGLQEVRDDSTYDGLYDKYFGTE